jgi:pyruvate,water dikinase
VGRLLGGRVGGWLANRLGGWLGDRLGGRLGGRLGAGLGGRSAGRLGGGSSGQGAGGGQGSGTAWDGVDVPPARPVLVVRSLDPALAPLLPELSGLVAETGSVLSHMAVLAREYRVPTVVGVPDAVHRFPPGTTLTLDGGTGAITVEQARDADGAGPDAADERSAPAAGRDGRGGAGPGRGEAGPGHADARAEYADAGPGHGATGGGGPDGRSERGDLPTGERGAPAGDVAGAHKGAAA